MTKITSNKAWVISVNMGYGHQRTAYPLINLAYKEEVINANRYQEIPKKDRKIWETARKSYEFISNFKRIPLIGEPAFSIFNQFQKILSFYPKRDLSEPNFQLKQTFSLINKGWGKHLIETLKKVPLPIISTFFIPAFMAEFFNYPEEIYCVICDADVSRTWASMNPGLSRIKYFAPTKRANERLKLYGVKPKNIFLTGYPLPLENIGTEKLEIAKQDTAYRLLNLDSKGRYKQRYRALIKEYIGKLPKEPNHCLTLMFAVGGAGMQKEIGIKILKSLTKKIKQRKIKVILAAGVKEKVKEYFIKNIRRLGLNDFGIEIIFAEHIEDYFRIFNRALRATDILWTKPSELSFYTGLGLPIIIAPSIGSQEDLNKEWLLRLGSGMLQKSPKHADEWLFDLLDSGWFAEAAMQGFVEGEKLGTLNIERIINEQK